MRVRTADLRRLVRQVFGRPARLQIYVEEELREALWRRCPLHRESSAARIVGCSPRKSHRDPDERRMRHPPLAASPEATKSPDLWRRRPGLSRVGAVGGQTRTTLYLLSRTQLLRPDRRG